MEWIPTPINTATRQQLVLLPPTLRQEGTKLQTTLQVFKKLVGRLPQNVAACTHCPFQCIQACNWTPTMVGMLPHSVAACPSLTTFFLRDPETEIEYLIDTGASKSLIPRRLAKGTQEKASPTMQAANGSAINTYGYKEFPSTTNPSDMCGNSW